MKKEPHPAAIQIPKQKRVRSSWRIVSQLQLEEFSKFQLGSLVMVFTLALTMSIHFVRTLREDPEKHFIVRLIKGNSMIPVLYEGDQIKIELSIDRIEKLSRHDLVVLHNLNSMNIVKRVIALPGDTFALVPIKEGVWTLMVNGKTVTLKDSPQPRLFNKKQAKVLSKMATIYEGKVPQESLILIGEDFKSIDSAVFGFVGLEDILGLVVDLKH